LGVILGQAISKSRLCQGQFRLGDHTVGATVMGSGCHTVQLSGSTVYYENVTLPGKNLPVTVLKNPVTEQSVRQAYRDENRTVLYLPGERPLSYGEVRQLAETIGKGSDNREIFVCLQADLAKALGHAIALQFPGKPCLCIDRVILGAESYSDIGLPVGPALPVVAKTLILSR
jgi:ethanolamine utilization protein EutA